MIKSWSFSSLMLYEKCPRATFYKLVERIPEPEPEPDSPLVRGNWIHERIERFIKNEEPLSESVGYNENLLYNLREFYNDPNTLDHVEVEGEWGFAPDWRNINWRDATCRMKLDVGVHRRLSNIYRVIDWKTGKKVGNEIKHTMQGQLYAIGALARYPALNQIDVEFHYVDHPDEKPLTATYNPSQIARFKETYNRRSAKMMSDTEFRPIPNKGNCKWCPFNTHCPTAVT